MALSSKGVSGPRVRSSTFEGMLGTLENGAEETTPSCVANPLASVSAPLGGHDSLGAPVRWELFYENFEETDAATISPPPALLPRASIEAVAGELNLNGARTVSELLKLRREFMWRNHPDRRPEIPRELANARVAVANMLIDLELQKNRG